MDHPVQGTKVSIIRYDSDDSHSQHTIDPSKTRFADGHDNAYIEIKDDERFSISYELDPKELAWGDNDVAQIQIEIAVPNYMERKLLGTHFTCAKYITREPGRTEPYVFVLKEVVAKAFEMDDGYRKYGFSFEKANLQDDAVRTGRGVQGQLGIRGNITLRISFRQFGGKTQTKVPRFDRAPELSRPLPATKALAIQHGRLHAIRSPLYLGPAEDPALTRLFRKDKSKTSTTLKFFAVSQEFAAGKKGKEKQVQIQPARDSLCGEPTKRMPPKLRLTVPPKSGQKRKHSQTQCDEEWYRNHQCQDVDDDEGPPPQERIKQDTTGDKDNGPTTDTALATSVANATQPAMLALSTNEVLTEANQPVQSIASTTPAADATAPASTNGIVPDQLQRIAHPAISSLTPPNQTVGQSTPNQKARKKERLMLDRQESEIQRQLDESKLKSHLEEIRFKK